MAIRSPTRKNSRPAGRLLCGSLHLCAVHLFFVFIHGPVRPVEHLVKGQAVVLGGVAAEGHVQGEDAVAALLQTPADAGDQPGGLVGGALGSENEKLVPAHPHGHRACGNAVLDTPGHPLEHQVAIFVTQGVVHPF